MTRTSSRTRASRSRCPTRRACPSPRPRPPARSATTTRRWRLPPPTRTRSEGNAGTTPFTFTVTRMGLTTGATTVNYAVTGSGAIRPTRPISAARCPAGRSALRRARRARRSRSTSAGTRRWNRTRASPSRCRTPPAEHRSRPPRPTGRSGTTNRPGDRRHGRGQGGRKCGQHALHVHRHADGRNRRGQRPPNYAVTGSGANPANAADFGGTLPSGQVSFAAGETSKTITINVTGDTTVESNEEFLLTLSNPSGGAQITTAVANGTIRDDDVALAIAASDADKPEGHSGNTPFTFTVTRTGLTTGATTVNYAVTGGGASAADFGGTLPSGQVSFAPSETSKTVTINVSGDTTVEPDESFSVTLSNASGGARSPPLRPTAPSAMTMRRSRLPPRTRPSRKGTRAAPRSRSP